MLSTLVAASLTVIGFIIGQVSEGAYKWDEDLGTTLEYTSGFLTGVYGMWNLYIFGLIFLYAPSHKKWGNEDTVSTGYYFLFIRKLFGSTEESEVACFFAFTQWLFSYV